jgi:hypothetical protein
MSRVVNIRITQRIEHVDANNNILPKPQVLYDVEEIDISNTNESTHLERCGLHEKEALRYAIQRLQERLYN